MKGESMKRVLLSVVCLLTLGILVVAQDEADYQQWMKTAGATMGSLNKNLQAKSGDAAAADAKKLEEVFGKVHDFWHKKKVEDAMKFAMNAQAGFKQVGQLAASGKVDDASASVKKATENCAGCHTAHREKAADGSWKIKY
jgi:hypothetical protein